MAAYIAEGIRYFRVAENNCELKDGERERAFVPLVFSAMYLESLVNEIIYTDQLSARMIKEATAKETASICLDVYAEKVSFSGKIRLIFERYGVTDYCQDKEFIELVHFMNLRNSLVHLKPIGQTAEGEPEMRMCKAALNYMYKSLRIITNPFGKGVFWNDVLMRKDVADWSISVTKNTVEWLYRKTYSPPFGDSTLRWHCQLLGINHSI